MRAQPTLLYLIKTEGVPMTIRMMSVSCMTCVVMCSDELFIPYAVGARFASHVDGGGGHLLRGAADTRPGAADDAEPCTGTGGEAVEAVRGCDIVDGRRRGQLREDGV